MPKSVGATDRRRVAGKGLRLQRTDSVRHDRAQRELPRTAKQQALEGKAIGKDTTWLMPGDLLTFGKGQKGVVSHIGIYVGNGRYVHASSVAGKVIESAIDRPFSPLIKVWRGARRVLGADDSTVVLATTSPPPTLPKQK